ncbi:hypothetical protein PFICI_12003 [Pestalotiopsis fici W106-1]|uniref:FAD-binding domain-containing protein n=1 Tax=Pestalotiopsis fici (strain W106-1 / CGMCC3.15140) TaxID=1229662 RepID=W3WUS8_PESFW|nr:uncharacterized protein PFICI_12003 [Pestalotiopsis fici W106-1]ETS76616.1 hypothetical protein PFICI_12003 [Pestalotiopsis fici W106-1]
MSSTFKVILVGGGPVGLAAAHALTRANIDFVCLESRPTIAIDAGASLVLSPMGLRVLGQLGLLPALNQVSTPIKAISRCDHKGNDLGTSNIFEHLKNNHGEYPRVISRHDLTKLLYDTLPVERQERMLPNKKVSNITSTSTGVTVNCADGTCFEGSIIIGADGAHSQVRQQMRRLAMRSSNGDGSSVNAENPFLTTFRALWMRFPTNIGLTPGQAHETHGDSLGIQLFAGEDTAVMGMYERLPRPTQERHRYSQEDEEALMDKWGHLPLTDGLTVRDAYNAKLYTGFVDLEEGVVDHWSWDRIVLAGDAAHKFTPSTGSGCNNGIADVVVLVNELHKIISSPTAESAEQRHDQVPSTAQLTAAFKAYQEARHENVAAGCQQSGNATAMATWQNTILKIVDKYVMPNQTVQRYFMSKGAITFSKSPVFDFVYGPEPLQGAVPWVQPILASKEISI